MQQTKRPVVLILGTMGSRLIHRGRKGRLAWIPLHPLRILAGLPFLECDESGTPRFKLEPAGCLDRRPLDFVGPLRNRLAQDGFSLLPFPYDWRQSLAVSARRFAEWVDAQDLDPFDIIGVSTGGLIATRYAGMGFASRIRRFVSVGTPFLGMPRTLLGLQTGAVLNGPADLFLARTLRDLLRRFPAVYEVLPCEAYFEASKRHYVEADGRPLRSCAETRSFLQTLPGLASGLVGSGGEFLRQLRPAEALRAVDTSYIVGSGVPTPAVVDCRRSARVRVSRLPFGDGSVPVLSQTIGGENERLHPGQSYEFRARHRTMHLDRRVMEQIAAILRQSRVQPRPPAVSQASGAA